MHPDKAIYIVYCRFLGDGLVSVLNYDTWKPRRKLYDPAFNKRSANSIIGLPVHMADATYL